MLLHPDSFSSQIMPKLFISAHVQVSDKTFRISNMGDETPATMRALLAALDDCLG